MNTTNNLDPQQQAAVDSDADTIMCIASAGSGKTRTLIARIQRLIRDGVDPAKICAVTYTNAGAKVMQERLPGVRLGFIGTLHSLALRMLQAHGKLIGLPSTVTVLDDAAATLLLEQCRERLRVKCTEKELSEAVGWMRVTDGVPHPTKPQLVALEYLHSMRRDGTLDFDLILDLMYELVSRPAPQINRFEHLFCDEMQDAAPDDWDIYDALGSENQFFVGDDSQSIYGFRGASVETFIRNSNDTCVSVFPLSTNYRSATSIITAANNLIQHNRSRIPNVIGPATGAPQGSVEVCEFSNPIGELTWIANELAKLATVADPAPSIAILWRTNVLSQQCSEHLRGLGIKVAEAHRPEVDSPEAKIGKAVLRCMQDPYSDSAAFNLVAQVSGHDVAIQAKKKCDKELASMAGQVLGRFHDGINTSGDLEIHEFVEAVNDTCPPGPVRIWLESLAKTVPAPFTIGDLLLAASRPEATVADTGGVVVQTFHAAKGAEYDCVILGAVEDDQFPGRDEDEEARRLLYVGMTRARTRLVITHVKERQDPWKKWLMAQKQPSRFLKEIAS